MIVILRLLLNITNLDKVQPYNPMKQRFWIPINPYAEE